MNNYLQYVLSLKDQMSASLKSIGINSSAALDKFASLEKQSKEVSAAMKSFGGSIGALKQKLDLLKNEKDWIPASNKKAIKNYTFEIQKLEKEISKLDGTGSKMGGGLLASITGGNLLSQGITRTIGVIKNTISEAISSAATLEQQRMSFAVMTGSQASGNKMVADLQKMASETPFETSDLVKSGQLLLNFGISADKIIPSLKMLGDVSAGDKDRLNSLSLAFAQTQSSGKLMGQDLLQYINAGFNPLNELSKMTGESMGVLKDKMAQGAISAEMVSKAFEHATGPGGTFFGMMDKQATTTVGRWSTVMDTWHQDLQRMGQELQPVTNGVLSFVESLVGVEKVSAAQKIQDQINKINTLKIELLNVNTPTERHKHILDELKSINPDIVKGIDDQATSYGKLQTNIEKVTGALMQQKALSALDEGSIKVLNNYTELKDKVWDAQAAIYATMAKAAPDILNSQMSFGMQQIAVKKELEKRIKVSGNKGVIGYQSVGGNGLGVGGSELPVYSDDYKNLLALNRAIRMSDQSNAGIKKILPALQSYNKQKFALSSALGITPAKMPGVEQVKTNYDDNGTAATGTGNGKSNEAVATGGTKNTTIHITIGKQIEKLEVISNNIREGAGKIRDIIVDEMTRAVAMSQAVAQ